MFDAPERKGETITIDADFVAERLERDRRGMKISSLFADPSRKLFSFEFFPPKTDAGQLALERTIRELAELSPAFVSVTYGAGGSTRAKTLELVQWIQREARICAMAHLTCVGRHRGRDRRRARQAGRRRHREHHGAARRSARRPGEVRAHRRRLRLTPPI